MSINAAEAELRQIPVDKIDPNPDNPRLIFRSGELDELLESIRAYGVQVPISVYREGRRYILIDGERRWKCSLKLNNQTIPALVQSKPSSLDNLLLMFNIHALREQWDLLSISLKLPKVINLLTKELRREPTESELAEKTGLNRGMIRRCKLLMALPQEYKDQILRELKKPKKEQKTTEDLFIEMERALTTVERAMPDIIQNRDEVRKVLIKKFKEGVIVNRVEFRDIAKIARAEKVGVDRDRAATELGRLFRSNDYTIERAYQNSVSEAYKERDIGTKLTSLLSSLEDIQAEDLDDDVVRKLRKLQKRVMEILRDIP